MQGRIDTEQFRTTRRRAGVRTYLSYVAAAVVVGRVCTLEAAATLSLRQRNTFKHVSAVNNIIVC